MSKKSAYVVGCYNFCNDWDTVAVFDSEKKALDWIEATAMPHDLDFENVYAPCWNYADDHHFFVLGHTMNKSGKSHLSRKGAKRLRLLSEQLDRAWKKAWDEYDKYWESKESNDAG